MAEMKGVSLATIYNRLKRLDTDSLVKRIKQGREVYLMLDVDRLTEARNMKKGLDLSHIDA